MRARELGRADDAARAQQLRERVARARRRGRAVDEADGGGGGGGHDEGEQDGHEDAALVRQEVVALLVLGLVIWPYGLCSYGL